MSKTILKLLLLVSTFAVYYLIISPLYTGTGSIWQPSQSVQQLSSLNQQYDDTLVEANTLRQQAESLKSQYTQVSEDQKKLMETMVPQSIDKVRLLSEVSSIIKQTGLATKDLTVTDDTSFIDHTGAVGVTFTVKTNYDTFKTLMDKFEKSLRLFSINSVTFTTPQTEGDLTQYTVHLQTYYIK
jgi:cell division protein FtsB